MKRIITLLLAISMLFSLAVCAQAAEEDFTKGIKVIWEDGEYVTLSVSAIGLSSLQSLHLQVNYANGLTLMLKDKSAAAADGATLTDVIDLQYTDIATWDIQTNKSKNSNSRFGLDIGVSSTSKYINATTETPLFKVYFSKDAGVTVDADSFENHYNKYTAKTNFCDNQTTYYFSDTSVLYYGVKAAPVEDKFINDEGATGGSTLTFYGRIGANWIGEDYGVIIEGKDFFGAKPGDVLGDGTTLEFAGWDGTFEIVFENITEKGTAGEKTYQFFVGDEYTEEATVVVE